jgi:hypothetical protein
MKRLFISQAVCYFEKIKEFFSSCDTESRNYSMNELEIRFKNPCGAHRDLSVYFFRCEAMLSFSYQRMNFEYKEDNLEYLIFCIENFISGRFAAVEFFRDGNNSMGGHRNYSEIDFSTAESIASLFGVNNAKAREILALIHPEYTEEQLDNIFENTSSKYRDMMLRQFREHSYKVCAECWDTSRDKYAEIVWDGDSFTVNSIKGI